MNWFATEPSNDKWPVKWDVLVLDCGKANWEYASLMQNGERRWVELCAEAAAEKDPEKRVAILRELGELLSEMLKHLRAEQQPGKGGKKELFTSTARIEKLNLAQLPVNGTVQVRRVARTSTFNVICRTQRHRT